VQDIGLKIQTLLDRYFEVYRRQIHAAALDDLQQVERTLTGALCAIDDRPLALADVETVSAVLMKVETARVALRQRRAVVERFVLDGL
jgi:hypothetical protein